MTSSAATTSIAQTTGVAYFTRPQRARLGNTTVTLLGTGNAEGHSMVGIYRGANRRLAIASLGEFELLDQEVMTPEEWAALVQRSETSSTR